MSTADRIVAPARDAGEIKRQLPLADPLAVVVQRWFNAVLMADDSAFASHVARLRLCLEMSKAGRSAHETAEAERALAAIQSATDTAAARALLNAQHQAIIKGLGQASTHLAALGHVDVQDVIVPSHSALPEAEATAATAAHQAAHAGGLRPRVREIGVDELMCLWDARVLSARGRWVDLGSGDGVSLARLAAVTTAAEVVGTDVAWSYSVFAANYRGAVVEGIPEKARYVVFGPGGGPATLRCEYVQIGENEFRQGDVLGETIRRALGPRTFDVVTMLYPMHMPVATRAGVSRSSAEVLLDTAIGLLRDGGVGFIVTENVVAWRGLLRALLGHKRVLGVDYLSGPISAGQLREMGIEPYTPSAAELDAELGARFTQKAASYDECARPMGAFSWGLPLLFTVRG